VEADTVVFVVAEWLVGVAKVDVVDFFAPVWKDVIEVVGDPFDGPRLREVELVEAAADASVVDELVKCGVKLVAGLFLAPVPAHSFESVSVHLSVGAVAVKKEGATEFQSMVVPVELGKFEREDFEAWEKILKAVMVAEEVVDLATTEIGREFLEPLNRGVDALGLGGKSAPIEVESIPVEDEKVGHGEILVDTGEQRFCLGPAGEQVQIGDDESLFHACVCGEFPLQRLRQWRRGAGSIFSGDFVPGGCDWT
jgi:hypothetical protein